MKKQYKIIIRNDDCYMKQFEVRECGSREFGFPSGEFIEAFDTMTAAYVCVKAQMEADEEDQGEGKAEEKEEINELGTKAVAQLLEALKRLRKLSE